MQLSNRIQTVTEIDHDVIERLITDNITAIIIKDFYPAKLAAQIAEKFIASETLAHYTHEVTVGDELRQEYLGVDREGIPFNLLYNNADASLKHQYYQSAKKNIARIRAYAAPALTPVDKLRLALDENYIPGAMVAAFQQLKMLAGIGRVSHAHLSHMSEDPPHFDALPHAFSHLDAQFAANIYLQVPESGGELELWDINPMTPLSTVPDNWRQQLPPSSRIKPAIGDLIIFNCRMRFANLAANRA